VGITLVPALLVELALAPLLVEPLEAGTVDPEGAAGAHASSNAGATSTPTARLVRSMN